MHAETAESRARFSDRVLGFMERVEHRTAKTPEEKEAVYRLRYEAYVRNGLIEPRQTADFTTPFTTTRRTPGTTPTFVDGEFAATVRINLAVDETTPLPSLSVFSDLIAPQLRAGLVVVDFTRAAARLEVSKQHSELPYAAMRPAYLAAQHFQADFAIATVRSEHVTFYRRVFNYVPLCEPRDYPNVYAKIVCMRANMHIGKEEFESALSLLPLDRRRARGAFGPAPLAAPPPDCQNTSGASAPERRVLDVFTRLLTVLTQD